MDRESVRRTLSRVRASRDEWSTAKAKHDSDVAYVMQRTVNEAIRNRMSVEEIATHAGMSVKAVRAYMRDIGLTTRSVGLLSKQAAENLESNAALMGIDPREMDLASPLAYLPAGRYLRDTVNDQTAPSVAELAYDAAVEKFKVSLATANREERVPHLTDTAIEWLANWLAGEGFE